MYGFKICILTYTVRIKYDSNIQTWKKDLLS